MKIITIRTVTVALAPCARACTHVEIAVRELLLPVCEIHTDPTFLVTYPRPHRPDNNIHERIQNRPVK